MCENDFATIMTKFDNFQTYVYSTLNASFVDVKEDLDAIFDDASSMLVAKVHQKAASLSHHAAKLDATHRVLQDLLTRAEAAEREEGREGGGGARGLVVRDEDGHEMELVEETVREVVRHKETRVAWVTFAAQAAVAFVAGLVVESFRLRKDRAVGTPR